MRNQKPSIQYKNLPNKVLASGKTKIDKLKFFYFYSLYVGAVACFTCVTHMCKSREQFACVSPTSPQVQFSKCLFPVPSCKPQEYVEFWGMFVSGYLGSNLAALQVVVY